MFNPQRRQLFLHLKVFVRSLSNPNCYHRQTQQYSSQSSPHFSSSTSPEKHSFAVSYFVNQIGFSPETALKCSKQVRFQTSQGPDSVLSFFKNHGFSDSQIHDIIRKAPWLLSCDPDKRVLPKFDFFLSKGVSASDIVLMVSTNPKILQRSLENHIIPTYEFIKGFLQYDEKAITCIKGYLSLFSSKYMTTNVKMLLEIGVTDSSIARLLLMRPSVASSYDLEKVVKEVKELGFHPSRGSFIMALMAKSTVRRDKWDTKVDAYKKWGWSEEHIMEAFKKYPPCMMKSTKKIDALMRFWVNHLGLSSLKLVNMPVIIGMSLEKRIIPRASVIKFLLSKGLMKEDASLSVPFYTSEKLFLEKYVQRFKEESSHILKLYQEGYHSIRMS